MKKYSSIVFAIMAILVSCDKNTSKKIECSFFPIYKGEEITYTTATVGNLEPGQIYFHDILAIATSDSVLFIDNYGFILRSCEDGSIWLRHYGTSFPIIDNSKNNGIIYSDSKYTVTQQKESTTRIRATVTSTTNSYRLLTITFIPRKGIKEFTSYNNDDASNVFYLK